MHVIKGGGIEEHQGSKVLSDLSPKPSSEVWNQEWSPRNPGWLVPRAFAHYPPLASKSSFKKQTLWDLIEHTCNPQPVPMADITNWSQSSFLLGFDAA